MSERSPSERRRVALAEAIASSWSDRSISYAVVHGLERYPARIGRDLDVAIGRESVGRAVEAAVTCARERGFGTALFRWSHWGLYQLALVDRKESTALALDLLCTTDVWRAKCVQLLDERQLDRITAGDDQLGPFRISEEGRFLKSCVRPLLCGDLSKVAPGGEWSLPVTPPRPIEHEQLEDLLGEAGASALVTASSHREVAAALPTGRVQRGWARSHPAAAVRGIRAALAGRVLRRCLNPAACVFVFAPGPEVVLEAAKELAGEAKRMFVDVRPTAMPSSRLRRMTAEASVWRAPPVSEFVVTVVVGRRPPNGMRLELRRRLLPTTALTLPGALSRPQARALLGTHIVDFLAGTYSPAAFLGGEQGGRREPAPVLRLEHTRT